MPGEMLPHPVLHIVAPVARLLLLVLALPLFAAFLLGYPLPASLALVTTTLVIEYGAAPVGIGLDLPPLFVLATLFSVALGVTLFLFDLIDTLGEHSARVKGFLARSAERGRKSALLSTYGIYGLVPCVMVLGFWVCPPVAGVLGWKRDMSIILIMAGFLIASVVTLALALGIADLFFGQGAV